MKPNLAEIVTVVEYLAHLLILHDRCTVKLLESIWVGGTGKPIPRI